MFTGIVADLATVVEIEALADDSARLRIRSTLVPSMSLGDSIAVNGVCLTAEFIDADVVTVLAMKETLSRTTLGVCALGDRLNAELALTLSTPLGGHLVQGHVDAVGTVVGRVSTGHWDVVSIHAPSTVARYLVSKGSVAIDGTSLTVVDVVDQSDGSAVFTVSLIPTTLDRTTLGSKDDGDQVNLEVDMVAKYIERFSQVRAVATDVRAPVSPTDAPGGGDK